MANITNTTNVTDCLPKPEEWAHSVIPVYLLCITVLGIVLNVFVLMVFWLHKKTCTMPEIYLSNLAAADLVLLACLPFWAVSISNGFTWPFGLFLCKAVNLGIHMNTYCSIYFLVLVSLDRYVALVHTMTVSILRRPKHAKLGCLLVWGFGLLMGIPTLTYRTTREKCNYTECYLGFPSVTPLLLCEGLLTVFGFIIPFFIISYCTVKIVKTLNNRLAEGLNSQNNEHKATTLVLAVLLAFSICWMPFHLLRIVEMLDVASVLTANSKIMTFCFDIFAYLAFFNSVLNPILYVIVGKNFQKKAREVFQQQLSKTQSFKRSSTRSHMTKSVIIEEIRDRPRVM